MVKYVANKLGGVHLDESRNPSTEPPYVALDTARLKLLDLDAVYAQLTALGQCLLASAGFQPIGDGDTIG